MIENVKHYGLFRVDVVKVILNLPHEEIARYCMETIEKAGHYTSYFDLDFNAKFTEGFPHKELFENDLRKAGDEFVKRSGRKPFEGAGGHRLNYWCSVYREHDQHGSHIHPRSLISGTYYPQTSNESAAISLEAPWIERMMHDTINIRLAVLDFKPNTGDCLMWPSWLNHRVEPQGKTEVPRIAISFNLDYNEVVG